jgi:hypothetical protein
MLNSPIYFKNVVLPLQLAPVIMPSLLWFLMNRLFDCSLLSVYMSSTGCLPCFIDSWLSENTGLTDFVLKA